MIRAVVWWCVVACLPQLALAANPPGELGALQAVYDYCTKVDPQQRGKFDRRADELFKGLTAQQVAAIRKSSEYQRGYHMLATVLPEIHGTDAVTACQAIAGPLGPPPHEPPHEEDGWEKREHQQR